MCAKEDITFFSNRGGIVNQCYSLIFNAESFSMAFSKQNNGDKWDNTTQDMTADPLLNPVRLLSCVV